MMDDTLRRGYSIQLGKERAEEARDAHRRQHPVASDSHPIERSSWLGLQVRSLMALVAVAEEGSFIGAAQRLGYSRSTISHQISQLEIAVGVSLLERSSGSRSVTVTPEGRIVVAHGRAVLKLLASAQTQLGECAARERDRRLLWEQRPQLAGS